LILIGSRAPSAEKPVDPLRPEALAKNMRAFLLKGLPPILYEDRKDWGKQKLVTRGLEWKGAGEPLPKKQKSHKNHGVWRHVVVTAANPAVSLDVQIRDVNQVAPACRTFTTAVAMD